MHEIELKFQVPPRRKAAVAAAVAGRAGGRTLRLQASYVDTADRALARAGIALRLRREDRHWVQTLKATGDDAMQRFEHNVPREGAGAAPPAVDVQLHAGTPAGQRLLDVLRETPDPALHSLFGTDIRRLQRTLRTRAGTLELAFDRGAIVAGDRRVAVCELEIELVRGTPRAVLDTARRWVGRHGLWLDLRSKAERGDLLARGETMAAVVQASPPSLRDSMTPAQGGRAVLAACMAQIGPNASQVASGDFRDEHVHQLRVGLRRLRTALRLFDVDAKADADAARPEPLAEGAAALFRQLGAARDQAAVALPLRKELERAMAAAGLDLPAPAMPAAAGAVEPGEALRTGETQGLLLDLLGAAQPGPDDAAPQGPRLRDALAARLNRWHRQVAADLPRFDTLDDEARHRLRKRVKRLRYAVEFAAPLFEARRVRRYLKALRALQDELGALNDVAVGLQGYRAVAASDPAAAFALGWLAARRERLLAACVPALRALAKARRFWK